MSRNWDSFRRTERARARPARDDILTQAEIGAILRAEWPHGDAELSWGEIYTLVERRADLTAADWEPSDPRKRPG